MAPLKIYIYYNTWRTECKVANNYWSLRIGWRKYEKGGVHITESRLNERHEFLDL